MPCLLLKNVSVFLKKKFTHNWILLTTICLGILLFHLDQKKFIKIISVEVYHSFCFLKSCIKICLFRFPERICSSIGRISSSSLGNLLVFCIEYIFNTGSTVFFVNTNVFSNSRYINVDKTLNISYKYFRLQLHRSCSEPGALVSKCLLNLS